MLAAPGGLPALPMQAWSLANADGNLEEKYFSWTEALDDVVDADLLAASLRALSARLPSLRAGLTGMRQQRIAEPDPALVPLRRVAYDPAAHDGTHGALVAANADLVSNTTGANLAVLVSQEPGGQQRVLVLGNHYVLDYYSVAVVLGWAFDRYAGRDCNSRAGPAAVADYGAVCRWIDQHSRDPGVIRRVLGRIPDWGTGRAPAFGAYERPAGNAPGGSLGFVKHVFGEAARRAFLSLCERHRMSAYWLGLALTGFVNGRQCCAATMLHVLIKESWRSLFPINTIGLPGFLAATSHAAIPLAPGMPLDDYIAMAAAGFRALNRIGETTAALSLPGQPPAAQGAYARLPRPALLYNCVNNQAFGRHGRDSDAWGIHRSAGHTKPEDIEVRFFVGNGRMSVRCYTRRDLALGDRALAFCGAVEDVLTHWARGRCERVAALGAPA